MSDSPTPSSSPSPRWAQRAALWLRNVLPSVGHINGWELARMAVGVTFLVWMTGMVSHWWGVSHQSPWLFAAMGSSGLLLISAPSSPMAQPWAVIGGGVLSGLAGWIAVHFLHDSIVAAAVAVGLSVVFMVLLRCLHVPGAALAMWMALEGIRDADILLYPVGANLVLMVLLATLYNRMTGKRYPAPQHSQKAAPGAVRSAHIEGSDLDKALAQFNGVLDVSRADLEALMHLASQAAFKRTLGNVRCEDIMAHPVHAVAPDTAVADAWAKMQEHGVKALPVVDSKLQVVGIVTSTDLLQQTLSVVPDALGTRLKSWVLRRKKADVVVADLMTPHVAKVQTHDRVVELIAVFSNGHLRHLPVVNPQGKLVGMVTQTDLIREMARTLAQPEA